MNKEITLPMSAYEIGLEQGKEFDDIMKEYNLTYEDVSDTDETYVIRGAGSNILNFVNDIYWYEA